jgi:hypothetical protein
MTSTISQSFSRRDVSSRKRENGRMRLGRGIRMVVLEDVVEDKEVERWGIALEGGVTDVSIKRDEVEGEMLRRMDESDEEEVGGGK